MKRTLCVLVLLVALAVPVVGDVIVAIHGHSDFSDGHEGLAEAFASMCSGGAQVAIVTDHAESFLKQENGKWVADQEKVERWKAAYRALSLPPTLYSIGGINVLDVARPPAEVCAIPAMEAGTFAEAENPTNRYCHFLFIGGSLDDQTYNKLIALIASERAVNFATAKSVLAEIVQLAHSVGAVVVAAHPNNPDHVIGPDLLELVDGAEVMNHSLVPGQGREDNPKAVISALPNVGGAGLVIGGIDWHGFPAEKGFDTFRRLNVVLTNEATLAGIVGALRSCRSYAVKDDVRITNGTELIGGQVDPSKPFRMQFGGLEGLFGQKALIAYRSTDGICRGVKECLVRGGKLEIGDLGEFLGPGMAKGGRIYICVPGEIYTSAISVLPSREQETPRVAEKPADEGQDLTEGEKLQQHLDDILRGGNVQVFVDGQPQGDPVLVLGTPAGHAQLAQPSGPQDAPAGVPPPIAGAGRFVSAPRDQRDGFFPGTSLFAILDLLPDGNGRLFVRIGDRTMTLPIGPENWPSGGRSLCVIEFGQPVGFNGPSGGTTRSFSMTGVALRWGRDASGAADAFRLSIHNMVETGRYQGLDPGLRNALSVMTGPSVYLYGVNGATWSR